MSTGPVPWVNRVRISNYKSIAACDVALGPCTMLAGPNGAGKSNFLDAMAFVADAVSTTPYDAVDRRGGLGEVLRRVPNAAQSFSITLGVTVPWGPAPEQWAVGEYGFEIGRTTRRGERPVEVVRETCCMSWGDASRKYTVDRGTVEDSRFRGERTIERDRLYLPLTSTSSEFRALFSRLRGIRRYNLDSESLRKPLAEVDHPVLGERGLHLGSVVGTLGDEYPEVKRRLDGHVAACVPGVLGIDRAYAGRYVTVEVTQQAAEGVGDDATVAFGPEAMSDGTIRAAGTLTAMVQPWVQNGLISLIGIEEPGAALHRDAARVVFDAMIAASGHTQIIATTQSAELREYCGAHPGMVRTVTSERGVTFVDGNRSAMVVN